MAASLAISADTSTQVVAALLSIDAGDLETAKFYGEQLSSKLQSHARAYGKLIEGVVAMLDQNDVAAIEAIRAGAEFADLWLLLNAAAHEPRCFREVTCKKRQIRFAKPG